MGEELHFTHIPQLWGLSVVKGWRILCFCDVTLYATSIDSSTAENTSICSENLNSKQKLTSVFDSWADVNAEWAC